MKRFFATFIRGIEFGALIFVFICVAGKYINEDFLNGLTANQFLMHVIGCMIVSEGYTLTGLVYDSQKLAFGIKILIHMGTGTLIYIITGCVLGWIPLSNGFLSALLFASIPLGFSFAIWLGFFIYNKITAAKLTRIMQSQMSESAD